MRRPSGNLRSSTVAVYRAIRDYAAIGDCHGAALIASDGGIDWCCLTRFNADPVFCRLLDAQRGGFLSTAAVEPVASARRYLEGTNALPPPNTMKA